MKQKLLLLFLLSFTIAFAIPKEKLSVNPAIAIMMAGSSTGFGDFYYTIFIKNIGEETLTNIYVTQVGPNSGIIFDFGTIASLAPGEEVNNLQAHKFTSGDCSDVSQVMVHATPTSSSTEITDLSSDPLGYDNNGLSGSYYNDFFTISYLNIPVSGSQEGIYEDTNSNSIVDVGDVVNYTYMIFSYGTTGEIFDNNAVISNPYYFGDTMTTGIHFITQADVDLGYVYNSSDIVPAGPCLLPGTFNDVSSCSCPNPLGANIITALTSLLPNQISGKVKFNTNSDNCITGVYFPNRRVSTTDGTYTYASYTNGTGDYHVLIPNVGNYNTTALTNLNANFTSNPASVNVTSSGSGMDYNNTNFCISSATNYTDLIVNMFNINQAIPGNIATYRIYYSNYGSTNLNGSIQLTFDNGKLTLSNATPAQNSATSTTLTWNYTNLLPFETRAIALTFNVLTPPAVNVSDLLNFTVVANPTAGDNNAANNTFTWNQTVFSSFDPNDKTVIEGAYINQSQAANYLNYVTRFQNTGTANATTVVIKEMLDPKLDWDSFEPIASSHTSNIQIKDGNDLTYTFSNINLPYESANEVDSHGWIAYRIKPKNTFAIGDIASSKSDIYFDYNLPIVTNTVTTEMTALSTTDFIKSNFTLYPNPASNHFVIESETTINFQYQIIDLNGKVLQTNTAENGHPIDICALQSGFYMVNIITEQGKATYKLIKN